MTKINFKFRRKLKGLFYRSFSTIVGFLTVFNLTPDLFASPASLTYQGRILKTDGTPLEYSNVSFIFQITNPSGQCVIYQEQLGSINMVNSGGVFDVPIGRGTVQYPLGGTSTILDAFNNTSIFTCGSCASVNGTYTCSNGSSTYAASTGDIRKLRVTFYDGSGWKTITPDNEIRSVPFAGYALSAEKLGTNVATDFLLKAGLPTCTAGTFLSYDGSTLTCVPVAGASGGTVTSVTSANSYLTVANGTSAPVLTLNVGTVANTVAAGNDPRFSDSRAPTGVAGGVLNGSYPNPGLVDNAVTNTKINDGAISTTKLFANTGVNRIVATDSTTGATLVPLSCTSGQLLTWNVATGWQCSAQSSLAVGSATIASTSTNFTGSLSGDISGTQGSTSVDKIKGVPLDFSVAPTNGQVLKFNGTNWVPSADSNAGGTITALTSDVSASGSGSVAATVNSVGGSTAGNIHSAELAANAATNTNTVSTIVKRDASGNFSAGTISANLTGNVTGNVTGASSLNVLKSGDTLTGNLTFASNKGNVFTDSGTNTVTVQAPTTVSTSYILKLPTAQGLSNQVLTNDGSGNLSWSTPSTTATSYSGVLPIANGGTGQSTYSDGQLLIGSTATNGLSKATLTAGVGVSITNGNGSITISATGSGGTVTSVSGTAPISVATGTSTPVVSFANGTTAGQIHRWDGISAWVATKLNYTDLVNSTAASPWPASTCTSGQAITWSSVSDNFSCSTLSIATSQLTGTLAAAQMPAFTGDATSSAGSTALTLSNSGVTAGTYNSVTVDAKGRVTTGTSPTTLNGYGITDAVKNLSGTPGIETGLDAGKPASPNAGTIYFATDTNKIYQYNSGAWATIASASGSGGTITALTGDVTASGTGSVAATVASVGGSTAANVNTAVVAVNTNATSNSTASVLVKRDPSGISNFKGLKLDGGTSGTLTQSVPATVTSYSVTWPSAVAGTANSVLASDTSGNLSWINLGSVAGTINLTSQVTAVLSIANGGTNSSTALTNNQLMVSNAGAIKELGAMTDGQIVVGKSAGAPQIVSMSGDVTMSNAGATTVGKINGTSVSGVGLANNNVLQNTSGSAIAGNSVLVSNGTGTGVTALSTPVSSILTSTGGSVPTWSSISSDTFTQYALLAGRSGGQTLYGGTAASNNLTLNSTSNGTKGNILINPNGGNVGIGTTSPNAKLHSVVDYGSSAHPNGYASPYARFETDYNSGVNGTFITMSSIGNGTQYTGNNISSSYGNLNLGASNSGGQADFVTIAPTGNVGIGATSPSYPLHVAGTIYAGGTWTNTNTPMMILSAPTNTITTNGTYYERGIDSEPSTKISSGITNSGYNIGFWSQPMRNQVGTGDSGTLAMQVGFNATYGHMNADAAAIPTTSSVSGLQLNPYIQTGTITNMYDIYINSTMTGGTLGNHYGIYQGDSDAKNYFSGKVGVGTNAPIATLEILGSALGSTAGNQTELARFTNSNGGNGNILRIFQNRYINGVSWTSAETRIQQRTDITDQTYISFGPDGNGGMALGTGSPGAERVRIDGNGLVGIGTTTPAYTLDVNGSARATGSVAAWSDIRAKKNIVEIPQALEKVLQVRGVTFDWRNDEFPDKKFKQGRDMGVIAQEIEKVFPEAVQTAPDGYKSVAYPELVAPLIEAVKELYKKLLRQNQNLDQQQRELASIKETKAEKSEIQTLKAENAQIKAEAELLKNRADRAEKQNMEIKARLERLEKMLQSK